MALKLLDSIHTVHTRSGGGSCDLHGHYEKLTYINLYMYMTVTDTDSLGSVNDIDHIVNRDTALCNVGSQDDLCDP